MADATEGTETTKRDRAQDPGERERRAEDKPRHHIFVPQSLIGFGIGIDARRRSLELAERHVNHTRRYSSPARALHRRVLILTASPKDMVLSGLEEPFNGDEHEQIERQPPAFVEVFRPPVDGQLEVNLAALAGPTPEATPGKRRDPRRFMPGLRKPTPSIESRDKKESETQFGREPGARNGNTDDEPDELEKIRLELEKGMEFLSDDEA